MTSGWQTASRPARPRLLNSRKSTRIATWNVRTMYQAGKADNVSREMTRNKIDALGITEARWIGNGDFTLQCGKKILYSGHSAEGAPHTQGVALMLTPESFRSLISWEAHGPRLMEAMFKTSDKNIDLRIIVVYAPTNEAEDEDREEFYEKLTTIYRRGHKEKNIMMLLGDMNAKVGCVNTGLEQVMGVHGLGEINENGEQLTGFCQSHNLVIGGTIFPHKRIHTATWKSPDNVTQNQIDHICISKKFRRSLLDVRVLRGADVDSDHYLLISDVQLKLKKRVQEKNPRIKYNTKALQHRDVLDSFKLELSNKFQTLENLNQEETEDVEIHWNKIKVALNETSRSVLGLRKQNHKPWITQDTLDIIEKRRELRIRLLSLQNQTQELQEEYRAISKTAKKSARRDKRLHLEQVATEVEQAANQNRMKEVYDATKKLSGKCSRGSSHIRDNSGTLLKQADETMDRWVEHFSNLLNRPSPDEEVVIPPSEPLVIDTNPPTLVEIKEAIKTLKNNKAAGPDNIPAEVLKADPNLTAEALHPLLNEVWNQENFPSDWKNGHLTVLPKKGDLTKCENYRGIMLLSVPGKIMSKIILNRMKKIVDKKLRKNQAGFRPNRSCADQITTLRIIIEQSQEWNCPLYINFIDYQKAFDSLDRNSLWKIMAHYGIPQKVIRLVRSMYENAGGNILHNGKLSTFFEILTGVRQGCLLSPFLFLLAIDWIMKTSTQNRENGIQWTLTKKLDDLDFADDVALTSSSKKQMAEKTEIVAKTSSKIGLKINVSKTKILKINSNNNDPITVEGENLEVVEKFTYLGSVIDHQGGTTIDVQTRINKARFSFSQLNNIWNSGNISYKTKLRLFNSNVMSVLLYGSETWFLSTRSQSSLQVFINKSLRRILKIFWPNTISNVDLHRRAEILPVSDIIKTRKWRWLGHTLRKEDDDITKQALRWNPQGRRRPGRPKNTWRRQLQTELTKEGLTMNSAETRAKDRREWRNLVRGLCPPP